ncbi:hypothetical protein HK102_003497 [Quaeritorhiza haematococci]|nr:hypothetical protein HK102_003497 [Quaeritorhiza haematococci]
MENNIVKQLFFKLEPYYVDAQQYVIDKFEEASPYLVQTGDLIYEQLKPYYPVYKQAQAQFADNVVQPLQPYVQLASENLAPITAVVAQAQGFLPTFKGYPVNYVGIAVIILHVLNYNITARLEYHTRIFTKIFGKSLAIYLYALYLIVSALIRDHYLIAAIEKDAGSRMLFDDDTATFLGYALMFFGVFLNLWVLKVLGIKGMYNGDSFGYLLKEPITNGPYRFFDDPQYFGTTCWFLGYAVKHQSRIGYGLTGVMYLTFSISVMVLEGPHLRRIYADKAKKEKKSPSSKKLKTKKTN